MENRFYKYWFKGLETAMENMAPEESAQLLLECGKACSRSYSQGIYVKKFGQSKDVADFIVRLQKAFPEMRASYDEASRTVEIIYLHCGCDLVKDGMVTTPMLCGCSQQSLKHNWECLFGEGRVQTDLTASILKGDSFCRFIVKLPPQA